GTAPPRNTPSSRRRCGVRRPDLDDRGAVHFVDLTPEKLDQVLATDLDHELVDSPPVLAFENVDGHDVSPHGPNPACDQTQGAGPVGQSDPHDVSSHAADVRRAM